MNFFDPIIVLSDFISSLQVAQASPRVLELITTKPQIDDSLSVKENMVII